MRRNLVLLFIGLGGAASVGALTSSSSQEASSVSPVQGRLEVAPAASQAPYLRDPVESEPEEAPDPYAGAAGWCEPVVYDTTCESDADCEGIDHVSTRSLRCLHPWWGKWDKDLKVCAPGGVRRSERVWREARLRELVGFAYFDEAEHCPDWSWDPVGKDPAYPRGYRRRWANGKATWEQHWRCTQRTTMAEKLTRVLDVVYGRETSKRPWKRHRLNPDQDANEQAWVRHAPSFGWVVEIQCEDGRKMERRADGSWRDENGRPCRKGKGRNGKRSRSRLEIASFYPDPAAEEHNPYYGDRWRWQYGLGGYGGVTALALQDWDRLAPPEALCREFPATEAYLRDARTAVRRYTSAHPPTCGGQPFRGRAAKLDEDGEPVLDDAGHPVMIDAPSWQDVHRVASGGKWCPRGGPSNRFRVQYARRMRGAGLNPDEPVTLPMLGEPADRDTQHELAAQVLARLEAVLPPPWR